MTLHELAREFDRASTEQFDATTQLDRATRAYRDARRGMDEARRSLDEAVAAERAAVIELCKAQQQAAKVGSPFRDLADIAEPNSAARELLALKQVAAMGSVSVDTVRRSIDRGDLETVTVGRRPKITREAADAWLGRRLA